MFMRARLSKLTPRLSEEIFFELLCSENFIAHKFQNVSNVKLWFLNFSLRPSFDHKYDYLYKLRHRKKLLENFRKFISQEGHMRI